MGLEAKEMNETFNERYIEATLPGKVTEVLLCCRRSLCCIFPGLFLGQSLSRKICSQLVLGTFPSPFTCCLFGPGHFVLLPKIQQIFTYHTLYPTD